MPMIQTDSQHYTDIADAIRDMSGNEETFYPSEMAAGVRSIPQTIAIQPIIYSLEEREVGVHTNGKPLYEKTYRWTINDLHNSNFQSGNMYGEFWFDHIAYDEFWMYDAKLINKGTNWRVKSLLINTPHESTIVMSRTVIQMYQQVNDGYPIAYFKSADSGPYADRNSLIFYYTIRYTKTTDTPGSGTWTPSGVPAHHYSTEEQVIGTWIDGKPLYEKTYEFSSVILVSSNRYTTLVTNGGTNIDSLVNGFSKPDKASTFTPVSLRVDSGNIQGYYPTDWSIKWLTIQYTKTTD